MSINYSLNNLMNTALVEPGEYSVTIENYEVMHNIYNLVEPDPNSDRNTSYLIDPSLPANAIIRKEHLRVTLTDTSKNNTMVMKLYAKRVPYFMKSINKQYAYSLSGMTLKNMLNFLKTHEFTIQLSYHPAYGEQYDFQSEQTYDAYAFDPEFSELAE